MIYATFRNRRFSLTHCAVGGSAQIMAATIPATRGTSSL